MNRLEKLALSHGDAWSAARFIDDRRRDIKNLDVRVSAPDAEDRKSVV
jgi:hypothetical protein